MRVQITRKNKYWKKKRQKRLGRHPNPNNSAAVHGSHTSPASVVIKWTRKHERTVSRHRWISTPHHLGFASHSSPFKLTVNTSQKLLDLSLTVAKVYAAKHLDLLPPLRVAARHHHYCTSCRLKLLTQPQPLVFWTLVDGEVKS